MTALPDNTLDSDEAAKRLRGERPADPSQDLDAQLHLAEMRQRFAGATLEAVAFGKWDVERKLGRGGMGTVYLARDRALGRRVALKVLPRGGGPGDRVREARALAASPDENVVQVHSVDESDPTRVVIEMEYVEGVNLRAWQDERRSDWRAIVEAYVAAGSGLATIHRAGLVHRDIKPDNILVSATGDVKVADFGLAVAPRAGERFPPLAGAQSPAALSVRITAEGELVGTLGYIAPEVLAGAAATASSDQFSFASALFEAILGGLPFQGPTPTAQAEALRTGALALPERHHAPSWLIDALKQALAFDPTQRHASMDALVRALQRGLSRRRRWTLWAVSLGVLAVASATAWSLKPPPVDPCLDAGAPMRALWFEGPRDAIVGMTAADPRLRYAVDVFVSAVDRRAHAWLDTEKRLCAAEHSAPRTDTLAQEHNLRQRACLDQTHGEFGVLMTALESAPDRALPEQLHRAAAAIESLPSCENRRPLARWPLNADGATDISDKLARSASLEIAGDYPAAEQLARELAVRPTILPFHRAEALYRLGHILGHQHRFIAAFDALDEARNAAALGGHEALACQAATYQAKLAANVDLDPQASARELDFARACATWADVDTPILKAELLEAHGLFAQSAGDLERASDWHRQALDLRRQIFGDAHLDVSKSHHNLANTLADRDPEDPEVVRHYAAALEIRERLLGPGHAEVADILVDRSQHLAAAEARADLHRALDIYERAPGSHHAVRANVHIALAAHDHSLDPAAAADHLEQARVLQDQAEDLPRHHPDRAQRLHLEGVLALEAQDFRRARALLTRALTLFRHRDPDSADALAVLPVWIEAAAGREDFLAIADEARYAGEALLSYLRTLPPDETGKIAWYVAEAFERDRAFVEAAAYLRLALDAYEVVDDPVNVAELRWTLARSLAESNLAADLAEARRLGETVLQFHRTHGPRAHVTSISRWLAGLPRKPRSTPKAP